MNALKVGLLQLNNVQLQRILDTDRSLLLFDGDFSFGRLYCPMVAGLSSEEITKFIYNISGYMDKIRILRMSYGAYFDPKPENYTKQLVKAGYTGTMSVIKEIMRERSERNV